jgi:hypothetical protein
MASRLVLDPTLRAPPRLRFSSLACSDNSSSSSSSRRRRRRRNQEPHDMSSSAGRWPASS